jgi:hypothetical protein
MMMLHLHLFCVYTLKEGSVKEPDVYLGADIKKYKTEHNNIAWGISSETESYRTDNATVWQYLAPLVMDGPAYSFIEKFARTNDGRGAIHELKIFCEGASSTNVRKNEAYNTMDTLQYNSAKNRSFNFNMYIEKLYFAYQELRECGEEVSESRKVNKFINSTIFPDSGSARNHVLGSKELLNNFDTTVQYYASIITNAMTSETNQNMARARNVASVSNTELKNSYSTEEWKSLPQATKLLVIARNKKRKEPPSSSTKTNSSTTTTVSKPLTEAQKKRKLKALEKQMGKLKPDISGVNTDKNKEA